MRLKKLLHLAVVSAGIAATTLVSATPAQAATCASGHWCLWTDRWFTGTKYQGYGSQNPLPEPINDDTFSVINNSSKAIRIYRSAGFSGSYTCVQPGDSIDDLTVFSVGRFGSSVKRGSPDRCGWSMSDK
ncbi:peptidase inhibitor family I36 protein [Sinosporangium album]|uniref:peptidase inhibitor family I36 protein n=1 Tax=Sinosporangium album TaxID=504805 RepID=UPI000B88D2E1|nr:peptidase inhibitor family I36 protein [Sinosporangium album]